MSLTVFFFITAAALLVIVAWGMTWSFLFTRIRRARHRRAIERREADMLRWGLMAYPRKSHYIPPEAVDSAYVTGQFSVGRDVKDMAGHL